MITPRALPSAEWEEEQGSVCLTYLSDGGAETLGRQLEDGAWSQEKGQVAIFNPVKGCQVGKE